MTTSFKIKSQILYFFLSLPYLSSYTWFSQLYYHTDNCQPYSNTSSSSLASILLQEMNKCYQTSSTSSTLMTCSSERLKYFFRKINCVIILYSVLCILIFLIKIHPQPSRRIHIRTVTTFAAVLQLLVLLTTSNVSFPKLL